MYKQYPDFIREGGSIPVTTTFNDVTGKSVVLLSLGRSDDGAHSQNEKMDRDNYIKGVSIYNIIIIIIIIIIISPVVFNAPSKEMCSGQS